MHINDTGSWCVAWLVKYNGVARICHSFFYEKGAASNFIALNGGELYQKLGDGVLKRA